MTPDKMVAMVLERCKLLQKEYGIKIVQNEFGISFDYSEQRFLLGADKQCCAISACLINHGIKIHHKTGFNDIRIPEVAAKCFGISGYNLMQFMWGFDDYGGHSPYWESCKGSWSALTFPIEQCPEP